MRRSTTIATLVAVVVLLLAELGARGLSRRLPDPLLWGTREAQQKAAQVEGLDAVDTVLLGSSLVEFGIDPQVIGPDTYNAAVGGMGMRSTERWARALVLAHVTPRRVVIGVSLRDMNDNGHTQQQFDDALVASKGYRYATGTASWRQELDRVASRSSSLVAEREYLRRPGSVVSQLRGGQVEGWQVSMRPDGARDFGRQDYATSPERQAQIRDLSENDFAVGGRDTAALRHLVLDLRRRGVEVLVVALPVYLPGLTPLLPHGAADVAAYTRSVRSTTTELGVRLLETQEQFADAQWFHDEYHLNDAGRARLSALVHASLP